MITQDVKMWTKIDIITFTHWVLFGFVTTCAYKTIPSHFLFVVYTVLFFAFNIDSWHRCSTYTKEKAERIAGRALVAAPNAPLLLLHRIFFFVLIFGGAFTGYCLVN